MSTHDRFEELLSEHAPSYREPDTIPREAMWQRIRDARDESRQRERAGAVVTPLRQPRRWLQGVAAAAALLLLGVAIGRYTAGTQNGALPGRTTDLAQDVPQAPGSTDAVSGAADAVPGRTPATASASYRMAATEYFGRVEVLLTQFGENADADDEVMDWSRSLLADTRMLLNSPAGIDPEYRTLLADLELVLAQIVRAAGRRNQEERRWVADGMQERSVLERLRMLKPAGAGT